MQIFRRYGKNANKLQFKCTDFNSSMRVLCMLSVFVLTEYMKYLSLRRHSYIFSSINCGWHCEVCRCLHGRLSTVPVSRNFFNSLLTQSFVQLFWGNSSVNLFAVYPFKYWLFIKIFSSSLNTMLIVGKHCSDVCCDEFSVPQIDRKGGR